MHRATRRTSRFFSALGCGLLVLVVVGGVACRKKAPTAPEADEPQPNAPAELLLPPESEAPAEAAVEAAAQAEADKVVVSINGREIGEAEVSRRVSMRMRQFGSKLASLPPAFAAQVQKQLRQKVLDNLVTEQLLNEQVEAAQIQITEQEVVAEMTKTAGAQQPAITLEEFKRRVEAQGGNFEDVKQEFRRGMGYRKIMESQWADKVNVAEAEAKKYYEEHPKEFETAEQVRASHILIAPATTDPNSDPNEAKAVAKEKAEKLLQEIKGGADFAELAKEHSTCPSSARGGDLDFFARGSMVKPFEDVAFALEPGKISDVVETEFGYHIIKVTDHKDPSAVSFEEAKPSIIAKLTNEKKSAVSQEYIQSLKDKATIVFPSVSGPQMTPPATAPPTTSAPAPGTPAPSPPAPSPEAPAVEPNAAQR